jgi:hypothetical protein
LLDRGSLNNATKSCQALWALGIELLYADLSLIINQNNPCIDPILYNKILEHVQTWAKDVELVVADRRHCPEWFQKLAPLLQSRRLTSLRFITAGDPKDPSMGPIRSALSPASWAVLDTLMLDPVVGANTRATLRNVKLPGYWWYSLLCRKSCPTSREAAPLNLLDSTIALSFKSTILQPGKPFTLEADRFQQTRERKSNGASANFIKRLLAYVGAGNTIDSLSMTGTRRDMQDQAWM